MFKIGKWTVYTDPNAEDGEKKPRLMGFKGISSIGPESYCINLDGKTFTHYGAPKGCACGNDHPAEVNDGQEAKS